MKKTNSNTTVISILFIICCLNLSFLFAQKPKNVDRKKENIIFVCDSTEKSFSLTKVDNKYYFHTQDQTIMGMLDPEKIESVNITSKTSEIFKNDSIILMYHNKLNDEICVITTIN